MKKILLIISILLTSFTLNAQVVAYKVSKYCYANYDENLKAFKPFSSWDYTVISEKIKVYTWGIEISGGVNGAMGESRYAFIEDAPYNGFSFNKKTDFKYYVPGTNIYHYGDGQVYAQTTWNILLSGTFKGEIYVYTFDKNQSQNSISIQGYLIE